MQRRTTALRRLSVFILSVVILSHAAPANAEAVGDGCKSPSVIWSTPALDLTMLRGTAKGVLLAVQSCETTSASMFVSPAIGGMLDAEPLGEPTITAGVPRDVVLTFSVPMSAAPGSYDGTVHVRTGNRTVPQTLKVTINVIDESQVVAPTEFATPSLDRLGKDGGQDMITDEILIAVDDTVEDALAFAKNIASKTGGALIGADPALRIYQLRYASISGNWLQLKQTRDILRGWPGVVAACRGFLSRPTASPVFPNDDILLNDTWDPYNAPGSAVQYRTAPLEAMRAPSAWGENPALGGNTSVSIAIIDSEFDWAHPELVANTDLRMLPKEAYFAASASATDKAEGWRFGHGTAVAGAACAKGNNGRGITGVAWSCHLLTLDTSLRLFGGFWTELTSPARATSAMKAAADLKVKVVNLSLNFNENGCLKRGDCSPTPDAIAKAKELNELFAGMIQYSLSVNSQMLWVVAAGNDGRDARTAAPAGVADLYPDNVIVVAAANIPQTGYKIGDPTMKTWYSNDGPIVDVAAPLLLDPAHPKDPFILTTAPRICMQGYYAECVDPYGNWNDGYSSAGFRRAGGTSIAAPEVTGLAALVWQAHPTFTAAQVKSCIKQSADQFGAVVTGHVFRVINAEGAVRCAGNSTVGTVVDTGAGPSSSASGSIVQGPNGPLGSGFVASLAGVFTLNQSRTIESVKGWMWTNSASGPTLHASIYSNLNSSPGQRLFTSAFNLSPACTPACPPSWQGPSGLSWSLSAGTYWVVFEGIGNDTGIGNLPWPVPSPLSSYKWLSPSFGTQWLSLNQIYQFGVRITAQ